MKSFALDALIYTGPGACDDRCSLAAGKIVEMAGLHPVYVTPQMIKPAVFKDAVLYVQPGGNAITAARALGSAKLKYIRQFINSGGGYLGFCAGAFLTDSTVDDYGRVEGLGLIPWETEYYPIDSGDNGILIPLTWNGRVRNTYFNGGGTFKVDPNFPQPGLDVLATFPNGQVASLHTVYGTGNVAITGAHPEALEQWKIDAGLLGQDTDGPDWDLAFELLCKAYPDCRKSVHSRRSGEL